MSNAKVKKVDVFNQSGNGSPEIEKIKAAGVRTIVDLIQKDIKGVAKETVLKAKINLVSEEFRLPVIKELRSRIARQMHGPKQRVYENTLKQLEQELTH